MQATARKIDVCECATVKNYDGNYHCMECFRPFIAKPDDVAVDANNPATKLAIKRIHELEAHVVALKQELDALKNPMSDLEHDWQPVDRL